MEAKCQDHLNSVFGDEFVLKSDIADFNHYSFPLIDDLELATLVIIWNTWAFYLDDFFDKRLSGNCLINNEAV